MTIEKRDVNITTGIIFRTILIILAIIFLYLIRNVLILLFIAILITAAIDPIIAWLQKKKVPRPVGVIGIYIVAIVIVSLIVSFLIPPIINQIKSLSSANLQGIKNFFQSQTLAFYTQSLLADLSNRLSEIYGGIFSTTLNVFTGIVSAIIILVMAFYMAVREDGMKKFVASITPDNYKERAVMLTGKIQNKIGKWMLGQIFLMFLIFILDLAALLILRIPFALSLAIWGGLMEIIPYIGPFLAAIPAILVAFLFVSPLAGLLVLAAYVIIQQAEGHIIVPQVMKKAVGINPIVVILALLVGAELGGVVGTIISVPLATAISVLVSDLMVKK